MSVVLAEQPPKIFNQVPDFSMPEPEKKVQDASLEQLRLLTEVSHYRQHMLADGSVPPEVASDIKKNQLTAMYEMAIPGGVTSTIHAVEYRDVGYQKRKRVITWLGKTLVENALGGKKYHWSEAAHKRVDVEIAEAEYTEGTLESGIAQIFISPKMSMYDADEKTAKSEHLYQDDSLRVSFPVTNDKNEVVARRLESLLVTDVPLEAWVNMLKDPHNMFGEAYVLHDEKSALSVMQLFRKLKLPVDAIPNGPVDLVAAVLPYIRDDMARASVTEQLEDFRYKQSSYREAAERATEEGFAFIAEIAKSLKANWASNGLRLFIMNLSARWGEDHLKIINTHCVGDTQYIMTEELAAVLVGAHQKLIASKVSISTDNKRVLRQMDEQTVKDFKADLRNIESLQAQGASQRDISYLQTKLNQRVAKQNLKVGGGCAGENMTDFNSDEEPTPGSPEEKKKNSPNWENKASRKWKLGLCQVKACPSRPKPTEVGPCDVCKRCQSEFDAGRDPTTEVPQRQAEGTKKVSKFIIENTFRNTKQGKDTATSSNVAITNRDRNKATLFAFAVAT